MCVLCVGKGGGRGEITETILIQMYRALCDISFCLLLLLIELEQNDTFLSEFGRAEYLDKMGNKEQEE